MSVSNVEIVQEGQIIELTNEEIEKCQEISKDGTCYYYFTKGTYEVHFDLKRDAPEPLKCKVMVPEGFLTDGSSGGPDYGISWLFHDYLYATHSIINTFRDTKISCTREEADDLMSAILRCEQRTLGWFMSWYRYGFSILSWVNVFGLFERAWEKSGSRGAEFAEVVD